MISRTKGFRRFAIGPRALGIIALCAIVFFVAALWRVQAGGLLWRALAPIVAARNALDASENLRLRANIASTNALIADRNVLYQENLDLKTRLGRNADKKTLLAGVLLRPPGIPYDTLVIDAGKAEGVIVGNLVSAGGSALIGRVVQVYDTTSRVVLFSAPGEAHEGLLSLTDGEILSVTLEGQGGGALFAKVPARTPATLGDGAVLPGIGEGLFALVVAIEAPEGDSFKTLHFHLPASPFALQYVEVWTASAL
jgi:cell shape-determining protein MreC